MGHRGLELSGRVKFRPRGDFYYPHFLARCGFSVSCWSVSSRRHALSSFVPPSRVMSQAATGVTAPPKSRGIVKQVLSGDSVVIRGQPRGGPPPERTVALAGLTAPRLARRANPNIDGSIEMFDEPFAWEAREFVRKLLIGKEVQFSVEYKAQNGVREFGSVWLSQDGTVDNVGDLLVSAGLVEVRQGARPNEDNQRFTQLELAAKAAGKGKWSKEAAEAVRNVTWNLSSEDLRKFVERHHGKELDGVVEHVRDGSTVRVMLVPQFVQVMVALSGVKCPAVKSEAEKESQEQFADVAKFFTESRLLQRDVKVILEGTSGSSQVVLGTVLHPAGNIAEVLLQEGFARCVDWSMAMVTTGMEKLRAAERQAKEKKLRLWKSYQPPAAMTLSPQAKNFTGKVVEVVNADALVVKVGDSTYKKIHFSSLRPPRPKENGESGGGASGGGGGPRGRQFKQLYDVPYMFEAREFLRKKLVGKKVNVTVDYLRPAEDRFPERTCCTVTREGVNIAEALISKGLATYMRHRQDDDQRSSHYDDLLAAQSRAQKNSKGLHSKKDLPTHRVADYSSESAKAKQFLPFLQRAGRTVALVEFVASGSRMRLYLPKDTCIVTFLLAGIICPRVQRVIDEKTIPAEPYGQEALVFTKELILQREVEVEVEAVDKGGNFIGWAFIDGKNISVSLVEEGLSKTSPQAERSPYAQALFSAAEAAKTARKNVWKDFVEPPEEEEEEEEEGVGQAPEEEVAPPERKLNQQKVIVTEVISCTNFWAQLADHGTKLQELMDRLRGELSSSPPLQGAFSPRKGAQCVAQFSDGLWYRAVVEKFSGSQVHILFIDYGNRDVIHSSKVAAIPPGFSGLPAQAKEYRLACVVAPEDEDWLKDAGAAFSAEVMGKTLLLNTEYKVLGQEYVTLQHDDDGPDIAAKFITDGLLRVERRRDRRLTKLTAGYTNAEDEARKARKNIWCYGDFTPDDAKEFGYQK